MTLMTLAFAGCSAWFIYDGAVKWPRENTIYREHLAFQEAMEVREQFLKEIPDEIRWREHAVQHGYPVENSWEEYSALRSWPSKPPEKLHSTWDVRVQFIIGGLLGLACFITLLRLLAGRRRQLVADSDSLYTPRGTRVPFARAYEVDKRKWANKGLAYVHYRDEAENKKRAVIDFLKYGEDTEKIMSRLLANFKGHVLEPITSADEEEAGRS